MYNKIDRAEAIVNRILKGNYSIEFYYYLANSLEVLLTELKQGIYDD